MKAEQEEGKPTEARMLTGGSVAPFSWGIGECSSPPSTTVCLPTPFCLAEMWQPLWHRSGPPPPAPQGRLPAPPPTKPKTNSYRALSFNSVANTVACCGNTNPVRSPKGCQIMKSELCGKCKFSFSFKVAFKEKQSCG